MLFREKESRMCLGVCLRWQFLLEFLCSSLSVCCVCFIIINYYRFESEALLYFIFVQHHHFSWPIIFKERSSVASDEIYIGHMWNGWNSDQIRLQNTVKGTFLEIISCLIGKKRDWGREYFFPEKLNELQSY